VAEKKMRQVNVYNITVPKCDAIVRVLKTETGERILAVEKAVKADTEPGWLNKLWKKLTTKVGKEN